MTIVEVLIVIAITSILLSLLLPAVQSARESSRRITCLSRLKGLGAACEGYMTVRGKYPQYSGSLQVYSLAEYFRSLPYYGRLGVSGHVELLPYLELTALADRVPANEQISAGEEPPDVTQAAELLNVRVEAFRCPSDPGLPTGGNSYRGCAGISPGLHTSVDLNWPNEPKRWSIFMGGMFQGDVSPRSVRDGVSQTVLYSERLAGDLDPERVTPWRDVYIHPQSHNEFINSTDYIYIFCKTLQTANGHYSSAGSAWVAGGFYHATYNHILPPNSAISDCSNSRAGSFNGAMTARSMHAGGVNVCFADGNCRFISENIDLGVWRSLATRDGKEIVSVTDF